MTVRRRSSFFLIAAVLLGGGAFWVTKLVQDRALWQKSIPPLPDLSQKHAELQNRLALATKKVQAKSGDVEALRELICLYLANGFNREAEGGLRMLATSMPQEPRWPHLLARQLAGFGRLDEALPLHERAVALAPEYTPARLKWADALLRSNRTEAAAHEYQTVLTQTSNQAFAQFGLARIDLDAGRLEQARIKLKLAIAADPTFAGAHSLLATVLQSEGKETESLAEQAEASKLGIFREVDDPWREEMLSYCYDTYALRVAAATLVLTKRLPAARVLLERAIVLNPQEAHTHRQLGKLLVEMQDPGRAREQFQQAIALEPSAPAPYLALINLFKASHDLEGGLRLMAAGLRACPKSSSIHLEYARVLVAADRVEESLPHFLEAQRLEPDNLGAYHEYAIQCFRLGREAEAVDVLDKVLATEPQFGPALTLLARYYIQAGNIRAAAKLIQRAQRAEEPEEHLQQLNTLFAQKFGRDLDDPDLEIH